MCFSKYKSNKRSHLKRQLILISLAIFSSVVAIAADAQNSAVLPVVVQSTHATRKPFLLKIKLINIKLA